MPSIQIRTGDGSRLLADWKNGMHHRRDPLKPLVTIVPSTTVAEWLRSQTQLVNVQIVTWTDWLGTLMPSQFIRWPEHADHVLEAMLPRDITHHLPQEIPGLYLTFIKAAIECRKQNISPESLDDTDISLMRALKWLDDQVFIGDLYDNVRLYEYANEHWSVLGSAIGGIIFWGFLDFSPIEWSLIETMGRHHSLVLFGLDLSCRLNWPKGASVRHLENQGGHPVTETISLPDGYLAPDAVARVVAERLQSGVDAHDMMVIADEDTAWRTKLALSHVGIATRTGPTLDYEVRALWRSLCRGTRTSRAWRRLRDRYPELTGWFDAWDRDWDRITEWDHAKHLVRNAAIEIPALTPLVTAMKRWDALAVICPFPDTQLLQRELNALAHQVFEPEGPQPVNAVWVVLASDAVGMTANEVVVLPEAFREVLRLPGTGIMDSGNVAALVHKRLRDKSHLIQSRALHGAAHKVFVLGATGERPYSSLVPIAEPLPTKASLAWYTDWYGTGPFRVQPGLSATAISVSDLERFGACPRAYFFARGMGLKTCHDDPLTELPALYGQWAHLALYYLNRDRALSVSAAVTTAMDTLRAPDGLLETVVRQARYRLEANLQYVSRAIHEEEEGQEVPYEIEAEVEWIWSYRLDNDVWPIRMRLDRLEHYDAHDVVVDFKTGPIGDPARVLPEQLQIPIYLSAWRDRFPDKHQVLGVLWGITEKNHFRAREVSGKATLDRETRKTLDGILERIKQGEFFPAPDPKVDPCRICDYRLLCPANVRHIAERKLVNHREFISLWVPENSEGDE